MGSSRPLDALLSEMDRWSADGIDCRFWWRDDDAIADTPELRRLSSVAGQFGASVALAVLPARATAAVADSSQERFCIWQHGWAHDFHRDGEFGAGRPLGRSIEDALRGQDRLDQLFGPAGWQRVFVPPNHMLAQSFKPMLPALGYLGLSAGDPLTAPVEGVFERNAIDLMDWKRRRLLDLDSLAVTIASELAESRRADGARAPVGLLTHHLAFGEPEWTSVEALLTHLTGHRAFRWIPAREVFPESVGPAATAAPRRGVSVVITSCGRQDLLERTIDSFRRMNTFPIEQFIVVEDGPEEANRPLRDKYGEDVTWLATGERGGQVKAIDHAYGRLDTPYVFHCEDDWEFSAPGFIEASLAVLESNPRILQVWLRGLSDTNGHPVLEGTRYANGVAYRLLDPAFVSDGWGTWSGFSWNPGLRRVAEYRAIGSYGAFFRPGYHTFQVERGVGEHYAKQGYLVAILTSNGEAGYVSHSGWGRRIESYNPSWLGRLSRALRR